MKWKIGLDDAMLLTWRPTNKYINGDGGLKSNFQLKFSQNMVVFNLEITAVVIVICDIPSILVQGK